MPDFNYNLTIKSGSKEQADKIAKALNIIYQKIGDEHLVWVADKISEDPTVIQKVIRIANNPLVKNLIK